MNPIELPRAMVPLTATAQAWACSSVDYLKSSLSLIRHTPEDLQPLYLALAYCEAHQQTTKVQMLKAAIAKCFLNLGIKHGQARLQKKQIKPGGGL
jgi:hypothetical protein